MKLPYHLLSFIGLALVLFRCEEPVELDLPIPDPKLVLVSNFFPNELVQVRLSSSQSILTSDEFPLVKNASIFIFEGDQKVEVDAMDFVEGENVTSYYTTRTFKPQVGVNYTIQASAPGYDPVHAVSSIPEPVPILSFIQRSLQSLELENGKTHYDLGVDINYADPAMVNNYYHLRLMQEIEICRDIPGSTHRNCGGYGYTYWVPVTFPAVGPIEWEVVTPSAGGGILIKDKPFTGALPLSVQSKVDSGTEQLGRLSAELRVVSQAYYDFNSSLSRQLESNDDPFQEPAPINNNVNDGLGVFAGYNYARDTLSLDL